MAQTKDPDKLIKEMYGLNNLERRTVSTNSNHKTDDGWNSVDK